MFEFLCLLVNYRMLDYRRIVWLAQIQQFAPAVAVVQTIDDCGSSGGKCCCWPFKNKLKTSSGLVVF